MIAMIFFIEKSLFFFYFGLFHPAVATSFTASLLPFAAEMVQKV